LTASLLLLGASTPWLLETAWAQRLISGQLRARGVEVSWEKLSLSLRAARLELTGLAVSVDGLGSAVPMLTLEWDWAAAWDGVMRVRRLVVDDVTVRREPSTEPSEASAAPRWSALLDPLGDLPPVHVESVVVRRLAIRHPRGSAEGLELESALHAGRGVTPQGFIALRGGRLQWRQNELEHRVDLDASTRVTLDTRTVRLEANASVTRASPPLPLPLTRLVELTGELEFEPSRQRVVASVTRASFAGDGAAATARLTLADGAWLPAVEAATAKADLVALLPLVRVFEPAVSLEEGVVDLVARADGTATPPLEGTLALRGLTHPMAGLARGTGTFRVEPAKRRAEVQVAIGGAEVRQGDRRAGVRAGSITLEASSPSTAISLRLALPLEGLEVADGPRRFSARSLSVRARTDDLSLERLFPLATTLELEAAELRGADVSLASLAATGQLRLASSTQGALRLEVPATGLTAGPVSMQSGRLTLEVPTFSVDATAPQRSTADVRLTAHGAGLRAAQAGTKVALEQVDLDAAAALGGAVLKSLTATVSSAPLALAVGAQRSTLEGGTLSLAGENLSAESAAARVDGRLLGLELHTTLSRAAERLEVTGTVRATTLAPLVAFAAPFLPDDLGLDLSRSALQVDGRVSHLAGVMTDDLRLRLERPAASLSGHAVSATALDVRLEHRGGGGVQRLTGTATLERPRVGAETLEGQLRLDLDGLLDRPKGVGALNAHVFALADEALSLRLDFDRDHRAVVTHRLSMDAGHLGPLLPLVRAWRGDEPELDLAALGVHLESKGTTTGLLDEALMPDPGWEAHVDSGQHVGLVLTNLVHHSEGETVKLPRLEFLLDAGVHHGAVHLESNVEAPSVEVDLGRQHATLTGLHQRLIADSDEFPTHGELRLTFSGALDALTQNVWAPWAPEAVRLEGSARVDRLSALSVDRFLLESRPAGTRLTLTKRLRTADALPGRVTDEAVFVTGGQRFVVDGALTQQLERLDGDPAQFRGSGTVTLPFIIDSADQQLFRVRGRLELADVTAVLPAERLEVHGASGVATLEEAVIFDPIDGLELVPSSDQRVFARARYQDLQPFLASDALITIQRVRYGDVELAPVVTSLEVQRNRFSLNKVKAQRGPALLSGQVFVDYQRGNRAVTFRGGITGLERAGAKVPLDANAALSFSLDRLELDGRVQVVRTSREHVIDLLDVLDPYREVGSLNRLRTALDWGYPRQLRLDFHDGLLAMDVELGGLGALFDLGTLRGIALGPFITRYLAPRLAEKESR
jgi:hypothetical protein